MQDVGLTKAASLPSDMVAIAAAVEKMLGKNAACASAPPRPAGVPQGPPHPHRQAALSSFLHSAAVLQQSLPSNDIMQLLRSALGNGEVDIYANKSSAAVGQPSLTPRHMSAGLRQAHMQQYMRHTAQHPHVRLIHLETSYLFCFLQLCWSTHHTCWPSGSWLCNTQALEQAH
jgi:hypothetical protein